jgi:hypothetical protein
MGEEQGAGEAATFDAIKKSMTQELYYEDLYSMIAGEKLGVGIYRKVGVYIPDLTLVIKVSEDEPIANFLDYRIWEELKDTAYAKWVTPCVQISKCGVFLLQKRVEHRAKSDYPKMIPPFFMDTKYKNYGWIGNQFVGCDYSGFSITNGFNGRMKKADWWE